MDALVGLPGSAVVEDLNPARSSYHCDEVKRAVAKLDPYRSDKTWERDAETPPRSKGGPA